MQLKKTYELSPRYDARQSFYGKALVEEDGNKETLYSYLTPVCEIEEGQTPRVFDDFQTSNTTMRHIREFLRQHGYKAESKAQILEDYQR